VREEEGLKAAGRPSPSPLHHPLSRGGNGRNISQPENFPVGGGLMVDAKSEEISGYRGGRVSGA